ncbi:hypothetical protein DFQ01_110110 [Paenibacillus cellulosilyticus]|uniref:Tight adherence protein B n=1 Tax=Paenibacillus cellulosilyticus TaxID=375489 RepID=A0A2V2YV31_9BACL|nr:hypothetical protein [Paenibacillus cellulosilyticus]PWW01220.1 hypothetical protein DFQ01_110110 [Paenibacillus cellulosilyticus]QKS46825.1 hypothetical protein HUB94_20290 [Paenibacillus cellulosilyticus]
MDKEMILKGILLLLFMVSVYKLVQVISTPLMRRWYTPDYLEPLNDNEETSSRVHLHLEMLLRATGRTFTPQRITQFIAMSASLFVGAYLLLLRGFGGVDFDVRSIQQFMNMKVLLYAAIIGLVPYGFKRLQLFLARRENSYALMDGVEALLLHYRQPGHEGDLYRALFSVTEALHGPMKRAFGAMVNTLQLEGKTSIRRAVALFEFQVQNGWAKQLSVLFIKAIEENRDIERALKKVHGDMTESLRHIEEEKSEYSEAVIMGFIPTAGLPFAIYGMNRLFEGAIWQLLFQQPKVFQALLLCVLSCAIGLVTSFILSKPKLEV